jgi:hypothetical protein
VERGNYSDLINLAAGGFDQSKHFSARWTSTGAMAVSSRVAKALHQRLHSSAASGKPSRWRRRQHQQQHQQQHVRSLAVPAAQTMKKDGAQQQQQQVFDRTAKTQQRSRAAKADDSRAYDYLRAEAADRLVDRLRVRVLRRMSRCASACDSCH